jgi:hypothetical protein
MKKSFVLSVLTILSLQTFAGTLVCQFKFDSDSSVTISNDKETGFMAEVDNNLQDENDGEILQDKKSLHLSFQGEQLTVVKIMTKAPVTLDFSKMTASQGAKNTDLECTSSEKPAEELAAILGEDNQGFTYSKANDKDYLTTAYVKSQSVFEDTADRLPASK